MSCINSPTWNLFQTTFHIKTNFTDRSKTDDGVAAAAVSSRNYKKLYACRLPGNSSMYTAELHAILLALKHVYHSKQKSFLILSDSLSALHALYIT